MKKTVILLFISILMTISLVGCAKGQGPKDESHINVGKKGNVTQVICESFDQEYYNFDELKSEIESEITKYNAAKADAVKLGKSSLKDKVVNVTLEYASTDDYSLFNGEKLFVGNSAEALLKGYSLNVILTDIKDSTKTISEPDIKEMTKEKLLITDCHDTIYLPGKVIYVSDTALVFEDNKSVRLKDGATGMLYAIYK